MPTHPSSPRRLRKAGLLLLVLVFPFVALGEEVVRVLGIGNSFTRNATFFLPEIIASNPEIRADIAVAIIGGCPLDKHVSLAMAHEADPGAGRAYRYLLNGEAVASGVPLKEILQDGEWGLHPDEMYAKLHAAYAQVAEEFGLSVIPVGTAFHLAPREPLWDYQPTAIDPATLTYPEDKDNLPDESKSLHAPPSAGSPGTPWKAAAPLTRRRCPASTSGGRRSASRAPAGS